MLLTHRRARAGLLLAAFALAGCGDRFGAPTRVEATAFRDRVLAIARREFPGRHFTATADPQVLRLGEAQVGLQSLYTKYARSDGSDEQLAALVKDQLATSLQGIDEAAALRRLGWEAARPLLRPQVVPREYLDRGPILHAPLARDVVSGLVIDEPKSYQYVTADELARWHVSEEQVRAVAVENLRRASGEEDLERDGEGPGAPLVVTTHDGYDAARLLVPAFRTLVARRLGSPFYAAMPSRDRL